jgi:AcrR family transcriptional regulator
MARPLKSQEGMPAKEKIEDAFWALLETKALDQMTVSELVRKVGCNRATFYYYFEDLNSLAEYVIEKTLPREIPVLAQTCFSEAGKRLVLSEESKQSINRLSLLIAKDGSARLATKTRNSLKDMWRAIFELGTDDPDETFGHIIDFVAGGIVGVLGQRTIENDPGSLTRCLTSISQVFSRPAMEFARQYERLQKN